MEGKHLRIFVACGTGTPFVRLLGAVRALSAENCTLFVQRGPNAEAYADLPGAALVSREQYAERLTWADVVICHAGAGTLLEAFCAGHHPIAAARLRRFGEMVNDHQLELVEELSLRKLVLAWDERVSLVDQVGAVRPRGPARDAQTLARPLTAAVSTALLADDDAASLARGARTLASRLWQLARARAFAKRTSPP